MKVALRLVGEGRGRVGVQKLVVNTFLAFPDNAHVVHYIEICGCSPFSFELMASQHIAASDVSYFYRDIRASDSMYDQYESLDPPTGRHRQTVGDTALTVHPTTVDITRVAPDPGRSVECFNVRVADVASAKGGDSWGVWLKVQQEADQPWQRRASQLIQLDLVLEGITAENVYWFLIMPAGYRAVDEDFREVAQPEKLQHTDVVQSVMQFELKPSFSVYADWSPHIYHGTVLRNRRAVTFDSDWLLRFSFTAVDDSHHARLTTASFLSGIILAIAGSAWANVMIYGVEKRFTIRVLGALSLLTIALLAAVALGWRSLVSRR